MLKAAIPLIRVRSSSEALEFYRDKLGFEVRSTYRASRDNDDPAYHVMTRGGATIHVSSFPADGVVGGVTTIVVTDIEELHDELIGKAIDVGLGIMDQPWGDREVYVRDAVGNTLRFQSE